MPVPAQPLVLQLRPRRRHPGLIQIIHQTVIIHGMRAAFPRDDVDRRPRDVAQFPRLVAARVGLLEAAKARDNSVLHRHVAHGHLVQVARVRDRGLVVERDVGDAVGAGRGRGRLADGGGVVVRKGGLVRLDGDVGADGIRAVVLGQEGGLAAHGVAEEDRGADLLEEGADGVADAGFEVGAEVEGDEAVHEAVEVRVAHFAAAGPLVVELGLVVFPLGFGFRPGLRDELRGPAEDQRWEVVGAGAADGPEVDEDDLVALVESVVGPASAAIWFVEPLRPRRTVGVEEQNWVRLCFPIIGRDDLVVDLVDPDGTSALFGVTTSSVFDAPFVASLLCQ